MWSGLEAPTVPEAGVTEKPGAAKTGTNHVGFVG